MFKARNKKFIFLFIAVWMVGAMTPASVFAEEEKTSANFAPNATSALLMDADSGEIIYAKNENEKLPPASITKIMTMLLIMEAVDQGKMKLDEEVTTSDYAASMGGSQIFLESGETMTVEELLKGIAMASGNDASVAMAEKIAGSEEMFVEMMNKRAKELGMENTNFVNSNGLPDPNHYSSAYDIAIMSKELLKYPKITEYTGKYQDYLRKDTEDPFWLVNTNKLVRFYTGADGLKTGYTSEAKFCLSATAQRNDLRLIAVVLGEPNTKTRNAEVAQLMDYGFSQYRSHILYQPGDEIGSVSVEKGHLPVLPVKAASKYSILMKKGEDTENIRHELQIRTDLEAPIKVGDPIGKLVVYRQNEKIAEFELYSEAEIRKAGWWELFKRTLSKTLFVEDDV